MTLARSVMMGQEPYRSVGGCERAVSSAPLQGTQGAREERNDSNFGVPTANAVSELLPSWRIQCGSVICSGTILLSVFGTASLVSTQRRCWSCDSGEMNKRTIGRQVP